MPDEITNTQARVDRSQEKTIHYMLELLAHKRRTLHHPGRFNSALLDIQGSARPLSQEVRNFLRLFLLRLLERERSRLQERIRAEESDATPQAEVNAAVRAILRNSGLD
jgi:hypothetical protein